MPNPGLPGADNGLSASVMELSGRLTRLETLVLEMTSQLLPVITKILSEPQPVFTEPMIAEKAPAESLHGADEIPVPAEQTPKKHWWVRIWKPS